MLWGFVKTNLTSRFDKTVEKALLVVPASQTNMTLFTHSFAVLKAYTSLSLQYSIICEHFLYINTESNCFKYINI